MPPRYAYWTILIDDKPTAFRAHAQEDLLPTLTQLRRTSANVIMKWFARGRIWESPEAEREAQRRPPVREQRGRDWRPGGAHQDPRDRFRKKKEREKDGQRRQFGPPGDSRPWRDKPAGKSRPPGPPRGDRPWGSKPHGRPQTGPRPWGKPHGAKAHGGPPRGDRPSHNKPRGPKGSGGRPFPRRDWRPRPPKKRNDEDT